MNPFARRERRRPVVSDGEWQRRHRPDYILIVLSALLLGIGLIVVLSIGPALAAQKNVADNYFINKQLISVLLGIVAFAIVANLSPKVWRLMEIPLLLAAGIASIAVRLVGEEVNGAYRWIQIGGLSFQAAELIKLALIVWLAGFLSDRRRRGVLDDWNSTYKPLLIGLTIIGFVVVWLQSDLGSAAVMMAIMGAMTFVAGIPMKRVAVAVGVIAMIGVLAIASSPYRRERVQTFLNPTTDCQGAGYQACQSLISVGSGGMFGLGLGRSVQAYGYQPEAGNDSIFAIFAEKFGFIGGVVLLGLFTALFARLVRIIERAPDDFSRFVSVGVLAWLSTQAMINIGAMIGLLPLKGITLPFISYGGTSLIFVCAGIGIVFSISRYTTMQVRSKEEGVKNEDSAGGRRDGRPHYAAVSRRP